MNQQGNNWLPSNHMPTTGVVRPQPSSRNYSNSSPQTTFNLNTSVYRMPTLQHQQFKTVQPETTKSMEFLQMNGNTLIQQNLIASQKKLNQDATRQMNFNEQKEKFCSYNVKGKLTADSMIENILEKSSLHAKSSKHFLSTRHAPNANSQSLKGSAHITTSATPTSDCGKKPGRHPLPLPHWLTDPLELPTVYKKAGDLVETGDGFVDTSRAYMLLMRTSIQPALLGVMWEMVNRTQPGRLKMTEFYGLLALVALVQAGQAVPSADYLVSLQVPVCPAIDHPVLAVKLDSGPVIGEKDNVVAKTSDLDDLDEFNDFVSAPPPSANVSSINTDASLQFNSDILTSSSISSGAPSSTVLSGVSSSTVPISAPSSTVHTGVISSTVLSGVPSSTVHSDDPSSTVLSGFPSSTVSNGVPSSTVLCDVPPLPAVQGLRSTTHFPPVTNAPQSEPVLNISDICFSSNSVSAPKNDFSNNKNGFGTKMQPSFVSKTDPTSNPPLFTTNFSNSSELNKYKIPPLPEPLKGGCKPKSEKINLPILGASPKHLSDDGFADFQSNVPPETWGASKSSNRYDVLRGITERSDASDRGENASDFDAEFGDFHSAALNASTEIPSVSTTLTYPRLNSVPSSITSVAPTFHVDEGRSYSMDPFGEFEDGSKLDPPMFQVNMKATREHKAIVDEDDFGDFVSSDSQTRDFSELKSFYLGVADSLVETQSVASLELPDLDETMNLSNTLSPKADAVSPIPTERIDSSINLSEEGFDIYFFLLHCMSFVLSSSTHEFCTDIAGTIMHT